ILLIIAGKAIINKIAININLPNDINVYGNLIDYGFSSNKTIRIKRGEFIMQNIKNEVKKFWNDEEGLGTLEIILIAAVLVAVALLFRERITKWVTELLDNIGGEIGVE